MTADQEPYTRIPNALLEVLATLPDAECRVMLVILRKTAGWQKACDVISYSQLATATGMSRQGVINGIENAIKRGILRRTPSGFNNGFCYEVVNEVDHLKQSTKQTSQRSRPQVVNEVDHKVVNEVDPQKKDLKKDLKKEREGTRAPVSLDFLHEGVTTYKRLTGKRTVSPAVATQIAEAVTDIPLWETVVTAWCGRYRAENVSGMLDWYQHPDKMRAPNGTLRHATHNGRHPDPRAEWAGFTETDLDKPL